MMNATRRSSRFAQCGPSGRALLLGIAVGQASCSHGFVERLSYRPAPDTAAATSERQNCTTRPTAPILDSIGAGVALIAAGLVVAKQLTDGYNKDDTGGTLLLLGMSAGFAASSYRGFESTGECREALRQSPQSWQPAPTQQRPSRSF